MPVWLRLLAPVDSNAEAVAGAEGHEKAEAVVVAMPLMVLAQYTTGCGVLCCTVNKHVPASALCTPHQCGPGQVLGACDMGTRTKGRVVSWSLNCQH